MKPRPHYFLATLLPLLLPSFAAAQQSLLDLAAVRQLATAPAAPRTLYVDATAGNDATAARGTANAFTTFGKAYAAAQPGDTIKLRAGDYIEDTEIYINKRVTIEGEQGTRFSTSYVNAGRQFVFGPGSEDSVLRGVEVDGRFQVDAPLINGGAVHVEGISGVTIENCYIHHTRCQAVRITGALGSAYVNNNRIEYFAVGVVVSGFNFAGNVLKAPTNVQVTGNEIRHSILARGTNRGRGINFVFINEGNSPGLPPMTGHLVANNTVEDTKGINTEFYNHGNSKPGFANCRIFGNDLIGPMDMGLSLNGCRKFVVDQNTIRYLTGYPPVIGIELAGTSKSLILLNEVEGAGPDGAVSNACGLTCDGPTASGNTLTGNVVHNCLISAGTANDSPSSTWKNNTFHIPPTGVGFYGHNGHHVVLDGNAFETLGGGPVIMDMAGDDDGFTWRGGTVRGDMHGAYGFVLVLGSSKPGGGTYTNVLVKDVKVELTNGPLNYLNTNAALPGAVFIGN